MSTNERLGVNGHTTRCIGAHGIRSMGSLGLNAFGHSGRVDTVGQQAVNV